MSTTLNLTGSPPDNEDDREYLPDEGRGNQRLHLIRETEHATGGYGINSPHEWYCAVCHARVTVTPHMLEVGHLRACPRRPSHLPCEGSLKGRLARVCPVCGGEEGAHRGGCEKVDRTCPTCEADNYATQKALRTHHTKVHGERLRTEQCSYCQRTFAPESSDQQYCSTECVAESRTKRERRVCKWCESTFEVKHSSPQKYCSMQCAATAKGIEMRVAESNACEHCGEEFYRHPSVDGPYCSSECYHATGREERACENCGDTFECKRSSDQRFCTHDCANAAIGKSRRKGEEKQCKYCGEEFYRPPSSSGSYCGRECYVAARRGSTGGEDSE